MSASLRRWPVPLVAFLLLLLLSSPAESQVQLGVTGGLTFSTLEGDDVPDDLDTSTDFSLGAFASFSVSEMLSLAPGLYLVQKGAENDERVGGVTVQESFDVTYLEVPVLLSLAVSQRENLGVNLFAGPEFAFQVDCSAELEFEDEDESEDCSDDVKSVDFGAIFGAGVNFPVWGSTRALVNGGIDLGLVSIDDSGEDNDVKHSAFFLNVGLMFPIGG